MRTVPEVEVTDEEFVPRTLVRHMDTPPLSCSTPLGAQPVRSSHAASLAKPVFPVWLEMFSLRAGKAQGYPTYPGYRRYGRVIRGTVNALERAWNETLKGKPSSGAGSDSDDLPDESTRSPTKRRRERTTRPSRKTLASFIAHLSITNSQSGTTAVVPELHRSGRSDHYWVADPAGRSSQDVLRNWVDPNKTVILTLDGQTHAEESRAIVTGQSGAKLWAVGHTQWFRLTATDLTLVRNTSCLHRRASTQRRRPSRR